MTVHGTWRLLAAVAFFITRAQGSPLLYLFNSTSSTSDTLFRDSTSVELRAASPSLGIELILGEGPLTDTDPSFRGMVRDGVLIAETPFNMSLGPPVVEDSSAEEELVADVSINVTSQCPDRYISPCRFMDKVHRHDNITVEVVPYGLSMIQVDIPDLPVPHEDANDRVLVCLVDSGLDREHEALTHNHISGCETYFYGEGAADRLPFTLQTDCRGSSFQPKRNHGTHVAGIIAAGGTQMGVRGINPQGARIHAINVFPGEDGVSSTDVYAAVLQCVEVLEQKKAKDPHSKMIINLSLGGPHDGVPQVGEALFNRLATRGDILVVAAAGNEGPEVPITYPAGHAGVISVAAVRCNGLRAAFSEVNAGVDLAAPGHRVLSTIIPKQKLGAHLAVKVQNATRTFTAYPVNAVTLGTLAGEVIDCGRPGRDPCYALGGVCFFHVEPSSASDQACEAAAICAQAGGRGAIVMVNARDPCDLPLRVLAGCEGSLGNSTPLVSVSRLDGLTLRSMLTNNTKGASGARNGIPLIAVMSFEHQGMTRYDYQSGTSMAAPHVAGGAVRLWSLFPGCPAGDIREALERTARRFDGKAGRDDGYGFGVVQVKAAHDYLMSKPCALES